MKSFLRAVQFTCCAVIAATSLACIPCTKVSAAKSSSSHKLNVWYDMVARSNVMAGIGTDVTVKELQNKIEGCTIQVKNESDETLGVNDTVGTGNRIVITAKNGTVLDEVVTVVYGDLDGDGKITDKDVDILSKHALNVKNVSNLKQEATHTAGVVDESGVYSSASSAILAARQHAAGYDVIFQNDGDGQLDYNRTTVNSVNEIINDQKLLNEGLPHGVPSGYAWYEKSCMSTGYQFKPEFPYLTMWGQVYEDKVGNPATNTMVQLRSMKSYYLSKSTGEWILCCDSDKSGFGGAKYSESFGGKGTIKYTPRDESSNGGGISVNAGSGYNYHFWHAGSRGQLVTDDVAALFMTLETRLVVDDTSKTDDRDTARFMVSVGADIWCPDDMINVYYAQDEVPNQCPAMGRFKYVKKYWRAVNSWWAPDNSGDVIRDNPPPIS